MKKIVITAWILCIATSMSFAKKSTYLSDWTKRSHSSEVEPNYGEVFPQGKIQRIDIVIDSTDWNMAWSDLSDNLGGGIMGERGGGMMPPPMMGEGGDTMAMAPRGRGGEMMGGEMMPPPMMGGGEGMMMGGDPNSAGDFTPIYIPCTVKYSGKEWCQVGFRFKGNSSLMRAVHEGNEKISIKLDFDEFEEQYPELKNLRFYGFKQLNLNSNFNDSSLMREKVASDLFRAFGLASAQSAFCEVYIDTGEGAEYYGLYTLLEDMDDSGVARNFEMDGGNLYKPEEQAGSFAEGSFNEEEFYLKTKDDRSYSDVRELYDALHDPLRTTDQSAWQRRLESIFDVKCFLRWLAANTTIQNWDTYGNMAHNYYLYNNPKSGLLTWITWDNNEAFQTGRNTWEVGELNIVTDSWPLISYIFEVEEYDEIYSGYLREFVDEVFTVERMQALYTDYYDLLKESAYAEESGRTYIYDDADFDRAVSELKTHVEDRVSVVNDYLN